jgi:signal transduction histidine kinase
LTRHTKGTGIGLALVKELAAKMHARVELQNHNPGAEFRLLLPVLRH